MDAISLRLEGFRELQSRLRAVSAAARGQALREAVFAGAAILSEAIGIEVQAAFTSHTGKLARAAVQVRGITALPSVVRAEVGPRRLPYAHLVARGHRIIARGPSRKGAETDRAKAARLRRALKARRAGGSLGTVAARPFIGPAFEQQRDRIAQVMLERLWQAVHTTFGG